MAAAGAIDRRPRAAQPRRTARRDARGYHPGASRVTPGTPGAPRGTHWGFAGYLLAPLVYFGQLVTHCAHDTGGDNNLLFCRPVMT